MKRNEPKPAMSPLQIAIAAAAVAGALAFAFWPRHGEHEDGEHDIDDASGEANEHHEPQHEEPGGGDPLAAPPDVAAPPSSAIHTASGLAYRVLRPGTGTRHPSATDTVTVHYTGWTTDGHKFDSSVERGQPATFPLDHVIAGWTEGLQLMTEGAKFRFWIPGPLAYDVPGQPARPGVPHGTLVFDVELIRF